MCTNFVDKIGVHAAHWLSTWQHTVYIASAISVDRFQTQLYHCIQQVHWGGQMNRSAISALFGCKEVDEMTRQAVSCEWRRESSYVTRPRFEEREISRHATDIQTPSKDTPHISSQLTNTPHPCPPSDCPCLRFDVLLDLVRVINVCIVLYDIRRKARHPCFSCPH